MLLVQEMLLLSQAATSLELHNSLNIKFVATGQNQPRG